MATKTEIDLTPFCGHPAFGTGWPEPFVFGGWRYATDAAVCVRIPAKGKSDTANVDRRIIDNLPALFAAQKGQETRWPAPDFVRTVGPCEQCLATGKAKCKCCAHEGECPTCNGKGKLRQDIGQPVNGRVVRRKHDLLVRSLPGLAYISQSKETVVAFKFDGGEGRIATLAMPVASA